ncbi:hypothetical protein U3A55_00985 [Salarchaeum sp. III]|uniref:hypothetical protein n=1 Tax=Salarchaeum sp. III TaxID=3107927 RepID=UPI002ED83CC8
MRDRTRALAVVLAGVIPWTVYFYDGGAGGFAAYGLLSFTPSFHVTDLATYLDNAVVPGGWFSAWLTGVLLYALALLSLVLAAFGLEDHRVTDGLLALAGLNELYFAVGFYTTRDYLTLPLGALCLLAVAVWDYRRVRGRAFRPQ